ncbi:hypothetical protein ACQ4PT_008512 [Festuca glaucescens]
MWNYSRPKDPTRVSEDFSTAELEKQARRFTKLTSGDDISSSCRVTSFIREHPPPSDHIFLSCLPPLPEDGDIPEIAMEVEGDTPEAAAEPEIPGAEGEDDDTEESGSATSIPPAYSKGDKAAGKRKRPSDDDDDSSSSTMSKAKLPIVCEYMDMATRYIGFQDEAANLKVYMEKSKGHAEDLEAKLKVAEKALEEARAKISSDEEKMGELKSQMASREAEIFLRLEALNASFINLIALADRFNIEKDPVATYHRSARKSGVEVTMAMAMAHEEIVDWDKVSSSLPIDADGEPKSLVNFLKKAKAFSKKLIPLVQPADAPPVASSSAAPTSSTAPSKVQ